MRKLYFFIIKNNKRAHNDRHKMIVILSVVYHRQQRLYFGFNDFGVNERLLKQNQNDKQLFLTCLFLHNCWVAELVNVS